MHLVPAQKGQAQVLLGSGKPNNGLGSGSLIMQLVCRRMDRFSVLTPHSPAGANVRRLHWLWVAGTSVNLTYPTTKDFAAMDDCSRAQYLYDLLLAVVGLYGTAAPSPAPALAPAPWAEVTVLLIQFWG